MDISFLAGQSQFQNEPFRLTHQVKCMHIYCTNLFLFPVNDIAQRFHAEGNDQFRSKSECPNVEHSISSESAGARPIV